MFQFQDLVLAIPYAWSTLPTDVYESLPHFIQICAYVTGLCQPVQHPFNSLPLTLLVPLYSCQHHLASYVLLSLVFVGLPTTISSTITSLPPCTWRTEEAQLVTVWLTEHMMLTLRRSRSDLSIFSLA